MLTRILLAEDEVSLSDAIKMNLELEDYEVTAVNNGVDALKTFQSQRFNLVILDVMMPKMSGFEVCEKIRLEDTETPILFLTVMSSNADKIKGLKLGADDYLTKPFNLEELILRVKIMVKHSIKSSPEKHDLNTYKFGNCTINFLTYSATDINGQMIKLTKKETMLLKLLIDRKGEAVSRNQILQYVWGYDVFPSTRTIDNFLLSFRKYFETDPKNPKHFHSIRSVGYKFTNE